MSFFFFSRRRRHTSYIGDWSSDVCSSDLIALIAVWRSKPRLARFEDDLCGDCEARQSRLRAPNRDQRDRSVDKREDEKQIGRASCREGVKSMVVVEWRMYKVKKWVYTSAM